MLGPFSFVMEKRRDENISKMTRTTAVELQHLGWGMCLFKVHKSQSSTPYTPVAILPALCLGLGLTPVLAEDASTEVTAADPIGLQKIDDGSVGKLEDAERLFMGALEEARQGFGERDPHVASACNNLVCL
ncbi:hypothetical protein E3N88_43875 [Mikania micrantha]|uniref:Uncharacterized protein n=1 Tax=Mikania micrantha TaxID=192012 RepID=A0A5N6LDP7_9ASTR|nr:hypothetical protein E3N88_43875 [Mikania micrantha]